MSFRETEFRDEVTVTILNGVFEDKSFRGIITEDHLAMQTVKLNLECKIDLEFPNPMEFQANADLDFSADSKTLTGLMNIGVKSTTGTGYNYIPGELTLVKQE